jgi:Ca2+-binding EF-hand superfamily protein
MRQRIRVVVLAVLLLLTCSQSRTFASKSEESEGFFQSLDRDADGDVDADELRKVLRDVGGELFDESHEIESGVESALKHDKDNDRALLHKDL